MGTGVATQRIENGELIRVDGDSGTVTLVDRFDPREEERRQAQQATEKRAAARRRKTILALVVGSVAILAMWLKRRR